MICEHLGAILPGEFVEVQCRSGIVESQPVYECELLEKCLPAVRNLSREQWDSKARPHQACKWCEWNTG
jgi:hypothetical protein